MSIIDIGPECFTDENANVISYKGYNYYKACGAFVRDLPEGGSSFCVKRVDHPGNIHEAFDGKINTGFESFSDHFKDCSSIEELLFQLAGAASMCWESVERAGVFESDQAKNLCEDALMRYKELHG